MSGYLDQSNIEKESDYVVLCHKSEASPDNIQGANDGAITEPGIE